MKITIYTTNDVENLLKDIAEQNTPAACYASTKTSVAIQAMHIGLVSICRATNTRVPDELAYLVKKFGGKQ